MIYTVTVIRVRKSAPDSTRCVGYYLDKDKAIHAVESNYLDIAELGYYKYAVIHPVHEGIHQIPEESESNWFKYDVNLNIFKWTKKPEQLKGWACVGIG